MSAEDNVTLLLCDSKKRASKTVGRDGSVRDFDQLYEFVGCTKTVCDIRALSKLLAEAENEPRALVIRGEPVPGLNLTEPFRRVKTKKDGIGPNFREADGGRWWVMLDLDKAPMPEGCSVDHPDKLIGALVQACVPRPFHDVTCHWQLSSSAGLGDGKTVSAHVWFWLDRRVSDGELKRWARAWNAKVGSQAVDPALFDPIQIHYIAAPEFVDGAKDPLGRRSGLLEGGRETVAFPVLEDDPEPVAFPVLEDDPEPVTEPKPTDARTLRRARAYLAKLPPSIEGEGGDKALWKAALVLTRGFALPREEALRLLRDDFNPRCNPRWDDDRLAYKVKEAIGNGKKSMGYLLQGDHKRPLIRLGADIHLVADEAVAALASSDLYQRDGELARIVHVAKIEAERDRMTAGTPKIAPVPLAIVRETLSRIAKWLAIVDPKTQKWVQKAPPPDIAKQVADRGAWPLPVLVGVTETPILRCDGEVFAEPGFDSTTGYFHNPSGSYELPEPTRDNARVALAELADVWCDFSTATDAERFVPVAAVLSILARPMLNNVPLFAFDAPARGSGKTLAVDTVSIIATGRATHKLNFPRGDEQEKVLGALALRGARVVAFDNATGPIGGDALDRTLTCGGKVGLRVLGKSHCPELSWTGTVFVTGNQLAITGDTRRRTLRCRIVPNVERPGERPADGFKHPDLPKWCYDNRECLVAAGLTVLRAFLKAGKPAQGVPTRGSFETWCSIIASAIVWAGGPDVVSGAWEESAEPEDQEELRLALARWWHAAFPEGATARQAVDELSDLTSPKGPAQDLRQEAAQAVNELCNDTRYGKATPRQLGVLLRGLRDVVIDGHCFKGKPGHARITVWSVVVDPVTSA